MPTYEYCCEKCEKVFDVIHSFKESPTIYCPDCQSVAKKQVTSFYMSSNSAPTRREMEQDLRENYGIYQTKMREGSFNSFYSGVKKDGDRVKEQMKQGEEADKKRLARKQADFQKKPVDHNRIQILKEHKAKKAYEKRTLALQE